MGKTFQAKLGSDIEIGCGGRVVPLDPFSVQGIGTYKLSFTLQSTVLVELARVHFKGAEMGYRP